MMRKKGNIYSTERIFKWAKKIGKMHSLTMRNNDDGGDQRKWKGCPL